MKEDDAIKSEFEELFRKNYSRLFYCALDILDDPDEAKDIIGDVCLEVWSNYGAFQANCIEAYLYTSVRNRALNRLRHQAVERQYQDEMLALRQQASLPEADLQEERMRQVAGIISTLPGQTQRIFTLCCLEEHSYKEAAEMLQVSVSAIHKHVSRALGKLRSEMAEKKLNDCATG